MDIYATREELKSRQKNIFDLKLNVAYYARVSTDKEEQKTSIEHQWTFFEQLISDVKNWTLVDGYIDEGISGITVTHREEFQRMLQNAKARKIDLIITKYTRSFGGIYATSMWRIYHTFLSNKKCHSALRAKWHFNLLSYLYFLYTNMHRLFRLLYFDVQDLIDHISFVLKLLFLNFPYQANHLL